jgi:hypothetical protein
MIAQGLTLHLLLTACGIYLASAMLIWSVLKHPVALLIAFVKVFIPLIYFAWVSDGTWLLSDDVAYFKEGIILSKSGFTPFNIFFSEEGIIKLFSIAGGLHFIYIWYNFLSVVFIGEFYYAPVFLNVFLSVVAAVFLYKMAKIADFPKLYRKLLFVFFLLHWGIISWNSFMNLKESVLVTMLCITMYLFMKIQKKFSWSAVAMVGVLLWTFIFIRFYLPIVIISAVIGSYYVNLRTSFKYSKLVILAPILIIVLLAIAPDRVVGQFAQFNVNPIEAALGTIKFIFTPRPWAIEDSYSFLALSSTLNVLFLIPTVIGAALLWIHYPQTRILIIFLCGILLLYGVATILQGPRHRVQVSFIFCWCQFHFIWCLAKFMQSDTRQFSSRILNILNPNL